MSKDDITLKMGTKAIGKLTNWERSSMLEIKTKYLVRSAEKYWNGEACMLMWNRYYVWFRKSGLVERIFDVCMDKETYSLEEKLIVKLAGLK